MTGHALRSVGLTKAVRLNEVEPVTSTEAQHTWPFARDDRCPLDPPPLLAELRATCPVAHVGLYDGSTATLLTTHADIRAALSTPDASADTTRPGFPHASETARAIRTGQRVFARMDDPVHSAHRRMVTRDFLLPRVREMRPQIEQMVQEMLDHLESLPQPADLVAEFANQAPSRVMIEILDLPVSDGPFFQNRLEVWHSLSSTPEQSTQAKRDLTDYLAGLIAQRRTEPGKDLMSRLVVEQLETGVLTEEQLLQILHVLLVGGYETTANMIALGTIILLQHPDQLAELKADPQLWPDAVEELLRYLSVAHQAAYRFALRDIELPGGHLPAGTAVIAPVMAANWDPAVFADPDRLDVHRDARAHLAFGYGAHQCLGQTLARVELQIVFQRLFERLPNLALATSMTEVPYKNSMVYGAEQVMVTW
jgi:cytochrome P450